MPPVSEHSSVLTHLPEISKPHTPVPSAWNGTNSQIKVAASSKTSVSPTTTPMVKVKVKRTTTPSLKASDPLQPSDPQLRPEANLAQIGTSVPSRACPRHATTSLRIVQNLCRVAEGEPTPTVLSLPHRTRERIKPPAHTRQMRLLTTLHHRKQPGKA